MTRPPFRRSPTFNFSILPLASLTNAFRLRLGPEIPIRFISLKFRTFFTVAALVTDFSLLTVWDCNSDGRALACAETRAAISMLRGRFSGLREVGIDKLFANKSTP